jgi:hypothetical protein
MSYEKSPRIRDIAEKLIDKHHPHLKDAKGVVEEAMAQSRRDAKEGEMPIVAFR